MMKRQASLLFQDDMEVEEEDVAYRRPTESAPTFRREGEDTYNGWILVYGYSLSRSGLVLEAFKNYGQILEYCCSQSNWMFLR